MSDELYFAPSVPPPAPRALGPSPLTAPPVYPVRQSGQVTAGADGTFWQYVPPNLTQVTVAGTTPALAAGLAVTPATVLATAGWYVMTTAAGVSTLLNSTGSTVAGITGQAYHLTWS